MSNTENLNTADAGAQCYICGKAAARECGSCGQAVCEEHLHSDGWDIFQQMCDQCIAKEKK